MEQLQLIAPALLVVMGVSGSGKTTVGAMVAQALSWRFIDADDHHPQANIDKMRSGIPLCDEDRWPWLHALNRLLIECEQQRSGAVLACSCLKQRYRDVLGLGLPRLRFAYLHGERQMLAQRLAVRSHGFMPALLLDSQLATLEPPQDAWHLSIELPPQALVASIIKHLEMGDTQ
jgi:gluconokinase